jgi:hypothetical protein
MKHVRLKFGKGSRRHRGADQLLFIVEGHGRARVNKRLKTLNVYVPPAYDREGDPLPRGRK